MQRLILGLFILGGLSLFRPGYARSSGILSKPKGLTEDSSCLIAFASSEQFTGAKKDLQDLGLQPTEFDGPTTVCKKPCLRFVHHQYSKSGVLELVSSILKSRGGILQSCTYAQPQIAFKPVIYLYPTHPQEIQVRLDYHGTLIADFPDYPKPQGWRVLAHPDGTLVNLQDQQEYSYLFWEGIPDRPMNIDWSKGFVVPGKNVKPFLQRTLAQMGLTPRERNEFIVYWYPKMAQYSYNLIHFAGNEYTDSAPLTITPNPDSVLRVFMVFQGLDRPVKVTPQDLPAFQRDGFTVVEWGGTQVR